MNETAPTHYADMIRQFIGEELLYDKPGAIVDDETMLLEEGYLDSMGIFRLIDFIEENFNVAIQPENIQHQYFQTIQTISSFVDEQKRIMT